MGDPLAVLLSALGRLLGEVADTDLPGALVIIDRVRVRVRPGRQGGQ